MDRIAREEYEGVLTLMAHGGKSLHEQSHGESFLSLLTNRFYPDGLYILDEPEAALSPQRQLSFLAVLHDLVQNKRCQFIIATHSPIILAYPRATIYSLDDGGIAPIEYERTSHFTLTRDFLRDRELLPAAPLRAGWGTSQRTYPKNFLSIFDRSLNRSGSFQTWLSRPSWASASSEPSSQRALSYGSQ